MVALTVLSALERLARLGPLVLAPFGLTLVAYVEPGREIPAVAGDHQDFQILRIPEPPDRLIQDVAHGEVDGIELFRAVQRDGHDPVLFRHNDGCFRISHVRVTPSTPLQPRQPMPRDERGERIA